MAQQLMAMTRCHKKRALLPSLLAGCLGHGAVVALVGGWVSGPGQRGHRLKVCESLKGIVVAQAALSQALADEPSRMDAAWRCLWREFGAHLIEFPATVLAQVFSRDSAKALAKLQPSLNEARRSSWRPPWVCS